MTNTKPFYKWTRGELVDFFRQLDSPTKKKLVLFGGAAALVLPLIVWPAWVSRPHNQALMRELRLRTELARAQIQSEPKLIEEKKAFEAFVQEAYSRLFSEAEAQRLLGTLTEMGQRSKVAILSSQPQPDPVTIPAPFDRSYKALSYLIAVEGGYHAMAAFVSEIENYPKMLKVDELSITPREETPDNHVAEIRLSAFLKREEK